MNRTSRLFGALGQNKGQFPAETQRIMENEIGTIVVDTAIPGGQKSE
jgi:hypothetical protein